MGHGAGREQDWHGQEFVYLWADGLYVNVRSEERRCLLVVLGCDTRKSAGRALDRFVATCEAKYPGGR